jgi:hypothetical protein
MMLSFPFFKKRKENDIERSQLCNFSSSLFSLISSILELHMHVAYNYQLEEYYMSELFHPSFFSDVNKR